MSEIYAEALSSTHTQRTELKGLIEQQDLGIFLNENNEAGRGILRPIQELVVSFQELTTV